LTTLSLNHTYHSRNFWFKKLLKTQLKALEDATLLFNGRNCALKRSQFRISQKISCCLQRECAFLLSLKHNNIDQQRSTFQSHKLRSSKDAFAFFWIELCVYHYILLFLLECAFAISIQHKCEH